MTSTASFKPMEFLSSNFGTKSIILSFQKNHVPEFELEGNNYSLTKNVPRKNQTIKLKITGQEYDLQQVKTIFGLIK